MIRILSIHGRVAFFDLMSKYASEKFPQKIGQGSDVVGSSNLLEKKIGICVFDAVLVHNSIEVLTRKAEKDSVLAGFESV